MIDTNEIAGFIGSCDNVDYLKNLKWNIEQRLFQLGVVAEPAPPAPVIKPEDKAEVPKNRPSLEESQAAVDESIRASAEALREKMAQVAKEATTSPETSEEPEKEKPTGEPGNAVSEPSVAFEPTSTDVHSSEPAPTIDVQDYVDEPVVPVPNVPAEPSHVSTPSNPDEVNRQLDEPEMPPVPPPPPNAE